MKLKGLYTALITPLTSEGKLDRQGLRDNLRHQLEHQVDGIVVLGTTGESPTLTAQEKRAIVEIAGEEVRGKTLLMVGTGNYSTQETIVNTHFAKEMGADAALVITPYYNKPTQEGLYRHFAAICEATSFPICIYNNPSRTSQNLHVSTLQRLASFPSIIGIKDSSGSIAQITETIDLIEKKQIPFNILSGDDDFTFSLMALGGHGVISVLSNLIPGPVRQLVHSALSGDFTQARQWHFQLLPLFRAIFLESNPIPIKAAMQLCGMPAGPCRLPLCDLDPIHAQKIKQIIQNLPSSWLGAYGQTQSSCR